MSDPSIRQPIVSIRNVSRHYGSLKAVDQVDLDIADGEFFTIVGPSGSGKTTLLRMLAGFEKPTSGEILFRGKVVNDVPSNRRPSCMVFQSLALFNHMSVGKNIEYSQKIRGIPARQRRERCLELMQMVHLPEAYYAKSVTLCSGGERQRVALARALAAGPEILFFDEPLSAIDYRLRKLLEMELKDLHRKAGKTFVYITHSLEEAMVMSDRIGIMKSGRLVQSGPPDQIYDRPNSRFVSQFMGEVNILDVDRAQPSIYRCAALNRDLKGPAPALGETGEESGHLIIRPEKVRIVNGVDAVDNSMPGRIISEYLLGSRIQYHVEASGHVFILEKTRDRQDADRRSPEIVIGWNGADAIFVSE